MECEIPQQVPGDAPELPRIRVVMDVPSIQYVHAQNSVDKPHQRYLYATDLKSKNAFGPIELSIFFRLTPESARIHTSDLQNLFKEKILWELHSNVSESSRRDYNEAELSRMKRGSTIPGLDREFLFLHKRDDAPQPFFELRASHRGTFEILIGYLQRGFYGGKYTFISYRTIRDAINNHPIAGKDNLTTLDFCHDSFLKFCRYNATVVIKSTGEPHSIIVDGTSLLPLSGKPLPSSSSSSSQFASELCRKAIAPVPMNHATSSSSSSTSSPMTIDTGANNTSTAPASTPLIMQKEMFFAGYSEYEMFGGERHIKKPSLAKNTPLITKIPMTAKRKLELEKAAMNYYAKDYKRSIVSFFSTLEVAKKE